MGATRSALRCLELFSASQKGPANVKKHSRLAIQRPRRHLRSAGRHRLIKRRKIRCPIEQSTRPEHPVRDVERSPVRASLLVMLVAAARSDERCSGFFGLPISRIAVNGRPVWHHRQIAGIERLEFFSRINRFSAQNCKYRFKGFDLLVRNCEVVVGQHGQIGKLTRGTAPRFPSGPISEAPGFVSS